MLAPAVSQPNAVFRRSWKIEKKLVRLRYRHWFRGKQFTSNWTSDHLATWRRVLWPLRDKPLRILEIGSWEGRSAVFFLNFFRRSTITCIDTFDGGDHYAKWASELPNVEARFDHNLAPFGDRVEKLKCLSKDGLCYLAAQGSRYDLAYVDGSHMRDDVMADSVSAWSLLDAGGVVIWDDYEWRPDLPPEQRPQPAIDAFLSDHDHKLLASGSQVIVKKA
jgi:predicted O-methyltransferase YrrM